VPNISGNAALDVLIGLFFLYFLLSIVCSSINEGIAAVFGLRAKYLERGLRTILGRETSVRAFYSHWRMRSLVKPPGRIIKGTRKPSYIPSRVFALTLLDTFAPPDDATKSEDLIARAEKALGPAPDESAAARPNEIVRGLMRDALTETREDVDRFRGVLERSFDEVMDRATGWYKRRVQLILFVLAIVLAAVLNADSFAVAQRLWKDPALRGAVVAQASKVVQAGSAQCAKTDATTTKADAAAKCVDEVKQFGLPLGWSHATSPHNVFWEGAGKVIGLLVTGFALSLGAPFWFDLLGKVSNVRGSGPPSSAGAAKSAGS
jgi:hypothetical protein